MDYSSYLPDIDVADGKARVVNNLGLYLRLVGKFDGKKLADAVSDALAENNTEAATLAAHALNGTAANLGFPVVRKAAKDIEKLCNAGEDSRHLLGALDDAMAALEKGIERLMSETPDSSP